MASFKSDVSQSTLYSLLFWIPKESSLHFSFLALSHTWFRFVETFIYKSIDFVNLYTPEQPLVVDYIED